MRISKGCTRGLFMNFIMKSNAHHSTTATGHLPLHLSLAKSTVPYFLRCASTTQRPPSLRRPSPYSRERASPSSAAARAAPAAGW